MKTANQLVYDGLIRHTIYLMRLIYGQQEDFLKAVTKANPELAYWVRQNIDVMKASTSSTKASQLRWNKLKKSLFAMRDEFFSDYKSKYSKELLRTIDAEIKYISALYKDSIGILEYSPKIPLVDKEKLLNYGSIQGRNLDDWFTKLQESDTERVITYVRQGMIENKGTGEIINGLLGDKKLNYTDGIVQGTRNGTKTLVRTFSMGIVNQAREEFAQANSDIIKKEIFLAVLDGRTTMECASLDETIFLVGQGDFPPLHMNCRSIRVAMIDGLALLGSRPYITDTRTGRQRNIDFRADAKRKVGADKWKKLTPIKRNSLINKEKDLWQKTNIGSVPVGTNYEGWLRTQSTSFQNEFLGRTTGELFRKGNLSLSKFVDLSGKKYNVDQLYALYQPLFSKYNIPYP